MSGEVTSSGAGFTPPSEPGKLTVREIAELQRIQARNIDQIANLIDQTHIKWLVYAAGLASVVDILHTIWLASRFIFKF